MIYYIYTIYYTLYIIINIMMYHVLHPDATSHLWFPFPSVSAVLALSVISSWQGGRQSPLRNARESIKNWGWNQKEGVNMVQTILKWEYLHVYSIHMYIYIHNIIQYRKYDANPIFGTSTRIDSPRWATLVGSCWSLIFRERSVSSVFLFKAWVGSFGSS